MHVWLRRRALLRVMLMPAALAALTSVALLLSSGAGVSSAATPPVLPTNQLRASLLVTMNQFVFLPLLTGGTGTSGCEPISTESYSALSVNPPPTDRPADQHADLNLGLRGYTPTAATLGLVNLGGPVDPSAPQFPGLFGDRKSVV